MREGHLNKSICDVIKLRDTTYNNYSKPITQENFMESGVARLYNSKENIIYTLYKLYEIALLQNRVSKELNYADKTINPDFFILIANQELFNEYLLEITKYVNCLNDQEEKETLTEMYQFVSKVIQTFNQSIHYINDKPNIYYFKPTRNKNKPNIWKEDLVSIQDLLNKKNKPQEFNSSELFLAFLLYKLLPNCSIKLSKKFTSTDSRNIDLVIQKGDIVFPIQIAACLQKSLYKIINDRNIQKRGFSLPILNLGLGYTTTLECRDNYTAWFNKEEGITNPPLPIVKELCQTIDALISADLGIKLHRVRRDQDITDILQEWTKKYTSWTSGR